MQSQQPTWLRLEFLILYVAAPLALMTLKLPRPALYAILWAVVGYALLNMRPGIDFSWRKMWDGKEWPWEQKRRAFLRFLLATAAAFWVMAWFAPQDLFNFPRQRFGLWVYVMFAYPVLSSLPQEIIYRSFFATRYRALFAQEWVFIAVNVAAFAFLHVIYGNWVAPALSAIGGALFLHSYRQHHSLKWVAIEHAAYGCMIFTMGLGKFFFKGIPTS